jgi:UDP-3-O-[3-hydroxymyristoyl] N-acetylglucosamine deacetylase
VLTALMADRTAWRVVEGETARRARIAPVEAGSRVVGGMIAAAYGPDLS